MNRAILDITCISDGIVPFRSFTLGLHDQMSFTVPVPYDPANDGIIAMIAASIAGTPATCVLYDAVAGTALISGSAIVSYEYAAPLDEIQMLNATFTFTGTLTGALVA